MLVHLLNFKLYFYQMNNWNNITTEKDFDNILAKSEKHTQIIFKDSITCGISAHAKERLQDGFAIIEGKADFNYLDLLAYRSISNLIAEKLGVTHQSPQIIIIKNKEVVHTSSHHAIDPKSMLKYL